MIDVALQKSYLERFSAIRSLDKRALLDNQARLQLTFKDIGPHSFFDYLGQTFYVKEANRYEETSDDFKTGKGYFIYELTCLELETGKTTHFEWEYDDELEISMTLDRLTFRDLKDSDGKAVDEDDLDQIADDKDGVVVNNETFWYEDDWASVFQKGSSRENVYMYEFENEGSSKYLSIEEWQGSGKQQYQIYTSTPVNPDTISIISKGDL